MRILFFVEPLVMHNRPFHYWAWLSIYARMMQSLRGRHELRVIVNEALAERARGRGDRRTLRGAQTRAPSGGGGGAEIGRAHV